MTRMPNTYGPTDDIPIVFMSQMLRFCRAMHSVSILHMDIKPDNWLLTRRPGSEAEGIARARAMEHSVSLIDFGRAIDLSVLPQKGFGTAFKGQCCASSFACPAMTEVRPHLVISLKLIRSPELHISYFPLARISGCATCNSAVADCRDFSW